MEEMPQKAVRNIRNLKSIEEIIQNLCDDIPVVEFEIKLSEAQEEPFETTTKMMDTQSNLC